MKGLRFGVATSVVVVLAILAAARVTLERFIPPLPANKLQDEPGEYLEKAVHEPVDWRPFGDNALSDARIHSKPTLLVIGTPWSRLARLADQSMFSNPEIATLINQNFIAIRVDAAQQPRWLSTFLPYSRLRMGFVTGFQAWVLDTHGRLLSLLADNEPRRIGDYNQVIQSLVSARDAFAKAELTDVVPQLAVTQRSDLESLEQASSGALPSFAIFEDALAARLDRGFGGFPESGVLQLAPLAWDFELRTGRLGELRMSLDPVLFSKLHDIVRSGFFRLQFVSGHVVVDFDEITVLNAQMVSVLSESAIALSDPLYRQIAVNTFDMLMRDLRQEGLFVTCRQGDEQVNERSPTVSFPASRMRTVFTGEESAWATDKLGLNPVTNPQMIPFPASRDVYSSPRLPAILEKMRQASSGGKVAGAKCLDVNGSTAACLVRCARLWGDRDRLNQVLDVVDLLDGFRTGNDVEHIKASAAPGTYLGDYLAYADAALQEYLATGRVVAFDNGLAVLRRAVELFKGDQPGVFLLTSRVSDPLLPKDVDLPEVVDDVRESCTAQAIRLLFDYGRLLGPTSVGKQLVSLASDAVSRFSQLPDPSSPRLAGYFVACSAFADPQCAFAVGPNSQELADSLARLRPNRLVAPVTGSVRPDLIRRKPGIYVVSAGVVAGPYTLAEAAGVMPEWLQVGLPSG